MKYNVVFRIFCYLYGLRLISKRLTGVIISENKPVYPSLTIDFMDFGAYYVVSYWVNKGKSMGEETDIRVLARTYKPLIMLEILDDTITPYLHPLPSTASTSRV